MPRRLASKCQNRQNVIIFIQDFIFSALHGKSIWYWKNEEMRDLAHPEVRRRGKKIQFELCIVTFREICKTPTR